MAGPVQTSVKKGVEESVALPCRFRVVRTSTFTVYACRLLIRVNQDLKYVNLPDGYGTQDCKGAVVLPTHDLVSALAVSFIIHLQLLNKSALHHVWSKLFL